MVRHSQYYYKHRIRMANGDVISLVSSMDENPQPNFTIRKEITKNVKISGSFFLSKKTTRIKYISIYVQMYTIHTYDT